MSHKLRHFRKREAILLFEKGHHQAASHKNLIRGSPQLGTSYRKDVDQFCFDVDMEIPSIFQVESHWFCPTFDEILISTSFPSTDRRRDDIPFLTEFKSSIVSYLTEFIAFKDWCDEFTLEAYKFPPRETNWNINSHNDMHLPKPIQSYIFFLFPEKTTKTWI